MRYVILSFMALLLLSGCGSEDNTAQDQANAKNAIQTADSLVARHQLYREAADSLTARFAKALKSELVSAMAAGSAVSAIGVCKDVAPAIARSHSLESWSIRRVSERNRNPNNRADTTQMRFLAQFADTSAQAPRFLVDWTPNDTDTTAVFTYYQPIRTQAMCLKCHGDMQTLGPGVYEALRKEYPMDKATGYKAGDLRGMFVVNAQWPAGTATARSLVAGEFEPVVASETPGNEALDDDTTETIPTEQPSSDIPDAEVTENNTEP